MTSFVLVVPLLVGLRSPGPEGHPLPSSEPPREQVTDGAEAEAPSAEPGAEAQDSEAQDSEALDAEPDQTLAPPVLLEFHEATYPSEAARARIEGRVVLLLTIDAEGRVTAAEIDTPAGHGLDQAAREAALRFRFAPARRGSTPVPARIRYAYDFELPAPPPPTTGEVVGHVVLPDDGRPPAVGVEVILVASDGQRQRARTDLSGEFRFEQLPAGSYELEVVATDLGTVSAEVAVTPGITTTPELSLLAPTEPATIEVVVEGESEAQRLRESAQAVQVIETEQAKRETADLGEVLARAQGVGVRRDGGLGSNTRLSLNGLTGDQIRLFLDGIPLELSGYPFGIANVPVDLVERVEVYRGVVPIRFGADALGGAVNLVSEDPRPGVHAGASYQAGSFDTHRVTLSSGYLHEPTGLFARAAGFFDSSANDYTVDVEVADLQGRLSPARVRRFHDAYRAMGTNVELGVVGRRWADRLSIRGFVADFDKELQHNVVMTVPFGEVEYGRQTAGATLRYAHHVTDALRLSLVGGYTWGRFGILDVGECAYDWFGQCIFERPQPGEIGPGPIDQVQSDHNGFGRLVLHWRVRPHHALELSVAPTYTTRTGEDRTLDDPMDRDPLTARRDLFGLVSGIAYTLDGFEERVQNVAFVKGYVQLARTEDPIPGGEIRDRNRNTGRAGLGDALRVRVFDWLYAKASYEWATRLPRADEIFGDATLILANLELRPEISHNANLGLTLDARNTRVGGWRLDANGFVRDADQLIVLLGNDTFFSHQNVFRARSMGVETGVGWTSPGDYVVLDGNVTYQDFRNASREGTFGDFEGDRIPNRPYLFAHGAARLQFRGIAAERDELAVQWNTRYVHEFFRGWQSVGLVQFKQVVDAQLLHSLALSYLVRGERLAVSFTGEVQNLTDRVAFDFFGVQRPGRALYFKSTLSF